MIELEAIAHEATRLRARGQRFLLATVVRTQGSSYRRPGARMLVALGEDGEPERWLAGCVSGGCLETDVLLRGAWRTTTGPTVVTYDSTADDEVGWGFGLGCNGVVDVLLERIEPSSAFDPTRFFTRCFEALRPAALVTVFASTRPDIPVGARFALGPSGEVETTITDPVLRALFTDAATRAVDAARPVADTLDVGGVTALVETISPTPHVFIAGTNHDALPLASLVRSMGWRATVCDTDARHAARFENALIGSPADIRAAVDAAGDAHVVIMTHSFDRDRELLRALAPSRARYLGVLGPARRTERIKLELGDAIGGRALFAPVGLDLGAETPQEIALSIVAEIQAVRREARAGSLRSRSSAIHSPRRIVAAVLAAGSSARLGRPKQLVSFRGEPLVRNAARAALASTCDKVAVIVGAERAGVENALAGLDVRCVENGDWREGVASSVRRAVAWARDQHADGLVVLLADQPLLSPDHVNELCAAVRAGAPAAASAYDDVVGVPAAFNASQFDALLELTGDRGAARVLSQLPGVVKVMFPEGRVDVDRESDVAELARIEGVEAR
jgi:xanthine dehydrogenase accessory factor